MSVPACPEGYRPCVGVLLLDGGGRIFVGERLDTPGAWQMPQGGIDAGETPEVAAMRELQEETGVTAATLLAISATWRTYDVPPEIAKHAWGGRFRGQGQIWVAVRFEGADEDIDLDAHHAEFGRFKWTDAETLLDEIVDFKRDVYAAVLGEFEALLERPD
jgi:putative (di)nucleoside polyphosphate hydrolase